MKASITALFLALAATVSFASDRWETLEAIHWVENPTMSPKPGPHGELGPYQFRPATWQMHTRQPFHLALDRVEADKIAVKHYEWIRRGLERRGLPVTPYNVALAWNAGLSAVINGKVPSSSRHYGARVANLVDDMKARQVAGAR
ncbi:MAG TPA: hypothetical protein VGD81_15140 [Opitutaceae bacterium]